MKVQRLGFTLIELLIVVAIIGILAAIAIPNFLEAQVRAKVAHAMSEMTSINTALEAYATDYTRYPISLTFLTTPVEYISDIFDDPFREGQDYQGGPIGSPYYGFAERITLNNALCQAGGAAVFFSPNRCPAFRWSWRLDSYGPDHSYSFFGQTFGTQDADYDPTNGTISKGNIWRYGSGSVLHIWKAEPCLVGWPAHEEPFNSWCP